MDTSNNDNNNEYPINIYNYFNDYDENELISHMNQLRLGLLRNKNVSLKILEILFDRYDSTDLYNVHMLLNPNISNDLSDKIIEANSYKEDILSSIGLLYPNLNSETIRDMHKDNIKFFNLYELSLLRYLNTPEDVIYDIYNNIISNKNNVSYHKELERLLLHPNVPYDILKQYYDDVMYKDIALDNVKTPLEILIEKSRSDNDTIRSIVATHKNTDKETLKALSEDKVITVKCGALENPNIDVNILIKNYNKYKLKIEKILDKNLKDNFGKEESTKNYSYKYKDNYTNAIKCLESISKNLSIPPELVNDLYDLSNHNNFYDLRCLLLSNPNAIISKDILFKIIKPTHPLYERFGEDSNTIFCAGMNSNLSTEDIKEVLNEANDFDVIDGIANNPNIDDNICITIINLIDHMINILKEKHIFII